MKITHITTSNFLGARAVDLDLRKPVALIAGKNGAGKSSVQEAIRMALTGETVRVSLKKEYDRLLSDGAESGFVEVQWSDGVASVVLPKGDRHLGGDSQIPGALPYVLDAQRFASLDDNTRRAFLFGIMGIKLDGNAVKCRMIDKGCAAAKIEQIAPMLRAGFDAAAKEAASKARDAKSAWRTITGETYGSQKAASWKAEAPAFDPAAESAAAKAVADLDAAIEEANRNLGALQSAASGIAGRAAKMAELQEKADRAPRIREKLARDEKELADWQQKVDETRARAGVATIDTKAPGQFLLRGLAAVTAKFLEVTCNYPEIQWDSGLINRAAAHLAEYRAQHGEPVEPGETDPEAAAKLPDYEKALSLLQSAVANGKRDLAAAEGAAATLKELQQEAADGPSEGAIMEAKSKVETLKNDRRGAQSRLDDLRATMRRAAEADSKTSVAAKHHADVKAWEAIAAALEPDGIPGEMLAEALGPINERLQESAAMAEWEPVVIGADMAITYGGRAYALISESEQWRTDAMIAEAISHISGLKLLVLDRFDVLDPIKGREDLLYWLDGMAQDGDIETALIFGTLKGLPGKLLTNIDAVWLENGTAGQLQEAA